MQEQAQATRQVWFRFDGKSRPMQVRPGEGEETEEKVRERWGSLKEYRFD